MKHLIIILIILFTGCRSHYPVRSSNPMRNPFIVFGDNRPGFIYGVHPVNPDKCPPNSPGKKAYNYHSSDLDKIKKCVESYGEPCTMYLADWECYNFYIDEETCLEMGGDWNRNGCFSMPLDEKE